MSVFLFTVPPAKPIIYDAKRRDMSKLLEAYPEGADLFLVCEVHGGKCQLQCQHNFTTYTFNNSLSEQLERVNCILMLDFHHKYFGL